MKSAEVAMRRTIEPCTVPGCTHNVERAGLCAAHRKRKQRRLPVHVELAERPRAGRLEVLLNACFRLLEAKPTDDTAWRRARDNLRKAAFRYADSLPSFRRRREL